MINWKTLKVISYLVLTITGLVLFGPGLNVLNMGLENKVFGWVPLKTLLAIGQGYVLWFLYKLQRS